jgi:uncharacterized protein
VRAVIDTNIIVSRLLFGGLPLKILRAVLERGFTYVTSPDLIRELERVLGSTKFGLNQIEIEDLTTPLFELAEIVVPSESVEVITRCPADNRVLECALAGATDVIVTGDKRDLAALGAFKGIPIVSPREFYTTWI